CAATARDAGLDGGRRPAARRDPRPGSAGDRACRAHDANSRGRPPCSRGGRSGRGARGRGHPRGLASLTGGTLAVPVVLAAAAGGTAAVAAREAVAASPALARWLVAAVEPLLRAGREGYAPTVLERRRLAA